MSSFNKLPPKKKSDSPKEKFEPNFRLYGTEVFYDGLKLLDSDKNKEKFIKTIERYIRGSIEYRSYIKYLKTEALLTQCVMMDMLPEEVSSRIGIEMHHTPFTLYDLVDIVMTKYLMLEKPFTRLSISNEVMDAHYMSNIGIVPLTVTAHQLAHNNILIVSKEDVFGSYKKFADQYQTFLTEDHTAKLEKIETLEKEFISSIRSRTLTFDEDLFIEDDEQNYDKVELKQISLNESEESETEKSEDYNLEEEFE